MQYQAEVTTTSTRHGLDRWLVAGLVSVESSFNRYAWNPEPRYRYFWNVATNTAFRSVTPIEVADKFPPHDFSAIAGDVDQEWWGQQASWGLMQILGAVAREHGFTAVYLPELCDPISNLDLGCLHLSMLITWAHGNVEQALSAYNGGKVGNAAKPFRNQAYASRVIGARSMLKAANN